MMSLRAIPSGGGFMDGVRFLLNEKAITEAVKGVENEVEEMLAAVRASPDAPTSWTDDEIYGMILSGIQGKK